MAVGKDSTATTQVTCPNCHERLRYNPDIDPVLPPAVSFETEEHVVTPTILGRAITCPTCASQIAVPYTGTGPVERPGSRVRKDGLPDHVDTGRPGAR